MRDIDTDRLRENGAPLGVLYLFSGRRRQGSVRTELERLAAAAQVQLEFSDQDLLNGDNLLGRRRQKTIIEQIKNGRWHVVLASPPLFDLLTSSLGKWAGPAPAAVSGLPPRVRQADPQAPQGGRRSEQDDLLHGAGTE